MTLCACGCGTEVMPGKKYLTQGHYAVHRRMIRDAWEKEQAKKKEAENKEKEKEKEPIVAPSIPVPAPVPVPSPSLSLSLTEQINEASQKLKELQDKKFAEEQAEFQRKQEELERQIFEKEAWEKLQKEQDRLEQEVQDQAQQKEDEERKKKEEEKEEDLSKRDMSKRDIATDITNHNLPPKPNHMGSWGMISLGIGFIGLGIFLERYPATAQFIVFGVVVILSGLVYRIRYERIKITLKKIPSTVDEILCNLATWSIRERQPMFMSKDKKQRLIQFVGLSRIKEPVYAWLLWNGVYISTGDIGGNEERVYEPPHDIRGNAFFYDLDRKKPLLDNLNPNDKDSHESLRMGQVRNLAFTLGIMQGARNLLNNLGTVQLLLIVAIIISLVNIVVIYTMTKDINDFVTQVNPVLNNVTTWINTHP